MNTHTSNLGEVSDIATCIGIISSRMKEDDDFAWNWHSNIAMCNYDAGATRDQANEGAARFMQLAFGVDVRSFNQWKWLQERKEMLSRVGKDNYED